MDFETEKLEEEIKVCSSLFETLDDVLKSKERVIESIENMEGSAFGSVSRTVSNEFTFMNGINEISAHVNLSNAQLNESLNSTQKKTERVNARYQDLISVCSKGLDGVSEELSGSQELMEGSCESLLDSLVSNADVTLESLQDSFDSGVDSVEEYSNDIFHDLTNNIINDSQEIFEATFEKFSDELSLNSEEIINNVKDLLGNLDEHAESSLKDSIDELVAELTDVLEDEVLSSVQKSMVVSQVSVQLTGFLQPYLPQLMVANSLAPSIQSLLNIMKMGF